MENSSYICDNIKKHNGTMRNNSDIRNNAKEMLAGRWGMGAVIGLIILLIESLVSDAGVLLVIFLYYPLSLGYALLFLHLCRSNELQLELLFGAFNSQYYLKSVTTGLLRGIYTFLWTLLLIVPGIIKSLAYSQAMYIIADDPDISSEEAINRSMDMMNGHKMQLFLMNLGELGLMLLSALLLFIPAIWIIPYYQSAYAQFYLDLKKEYESRL